MILTVLCPGSWPAWTQKATPHDVLSPVLAGSQLLCVHAAVSTYYERFKSMLSPSNAMQVQLLMRLASTLHSCISGSGHESQQEQVRHVSLLAGMPALQGIRHMTLSHHLPMSCVY